MFPLRFRKKGAPPPKRVALLLSGELRTIEYCLPRQLAALRDIPHVSIFLSCWDSSRPSFRKPRKASSAIHNQVYWDNDRITKEDILKAFPPITTIDIASREQTSAEHALIAGRAAHYVKKHRPNKLSEQKLQFLFRTSLNQLYLVERAFKHMKIFEEETGVAFDCVIRSRPDIVWKNKLQWPHENQLIIDCLKVSRRRKGMIFDGFYICPRACADKMVMNYATHLSTLRSQKGIFQEYTYYFLQNLRYLYLSKPRRINVKYTNGKKAEDTLLENESFFRYQLSRSLELEVIDARLQVKLVR